MSSVKRVVQFGLGTIGCAVARLVTERDDLSLIGAIDSNPDKAGVDIAQLLGLNHPTNIVVESEARDALARLRPDLVLHATGSKLGVVADQLLLALEYGADVASTCEELSYPFADEPDLSSRLDEAARASGRRLVGAGVNPGFVMDVLPAVLSAVCGRVDRLIAVRVVDTDQRRAQLRTKTGAGLSAAEFRAGLARGELGHVGLTQSLRMLASAVGWSLDEVTETVDERLALTTIAGTSREIPAGSVTGLHQLAVGRVNGFDRIILDLTMEVGAENPRDEIVIEGEPPVRFVVPGGISGDIATSSILVNVASRIAPLAPGLRTMLDVFPVAARGTRA